MTKVVIVNGRPRAGKDTFIDMVSMFARNGGKTVRSFSSIDPVRDMLRQAGFNLDRKTPKDRKLLAIVGDAVQEHSFWRTDQCIEAIVKLHREAQGRGVMLLHIREPKNIGIIRQWCESGLFVSVSTVFIDSDRAETVASNAADAEVEDMEYDVRITNHGTLEDLNTKALAFCNHVLLGSPNQLNVDYKSSKEQP